MDPRDPTADVEPDFNDEIWRIPRDALVDRENTVEGAVDILRQSWRALHQKNLDAWNAHLEQRRNEGPPGGNNEDVIPVTPPLTTNETPDWINLPTPSFLDIQPARHVRNWRRRNS